MRRSIFIVCLLFFASIPVVLLSQTRQITGTVRNEQGEPVSQASVLFRGTNTGVAADLNGRFSISVQGSRPILVISAVGFQPQEVVIGNANDYSVTLKRGDDLSEVVVTAFGIRKNKKALGYSAQEIKGADLVASRQSNVVNALQGKVAGVQINSTGGAPGQGARIIIRGIKSLDPSRNNQPLFVIDGVIMDNNTVTGSDAADLRGLSNRAADINPDDVESISVLKGGAATALYGQAGSNGVVVITTKSARAGKMRIDFTTTYGIDQVNKFPDVQMRFSQGFLGVYSSTDFFPSWGPTVEQAKAIDPTHPNSIFNHYKRGYQQGNQFRTSINLSGGTDKSLLSASFSYLKQNGTIPNSDYKNITARLNGQFRFSDKLKISPSIYFINSGGYRVNADRYNEQLTYWSPRWDVKDYIKPDGTMKSYGNDNPVFGTSVNRFKDDVNRVIGNVAVTLSPFKWLDVDYRLGIDYYADFRRHAGPGPKGLADEIPFSDNGLGFVNEYRISNRIINSNLIATVKRDWSEKFNSVLRVGTESRDFNQNSLTATGDELDVPDLLSLNNTRNRSNSELLTKYRIVSLFGDLTLGWDNYLYLDVTGRNDWSSALADENNSFFYPSASLSYIFSQNLHLPQWFSFGKFRASWAEIGKDTDPYRINTYYNSSVINSSGQVTWTRSNSKGDRTLRPERTTTLEFGTDLRFLKSRLGLDFSWYKLNSRDQIIPVSVSPTSGFTEFVINAGEIENKGIEVVLNGNPVQTKDFRWDISVNYSRNTNKILSIREGLTEIVVGSQFGYAGSSATMKYVPGYSVGNIYGTSDLRYYGKETDDKIHLYRDLPRVIAATGSNAGFPVRDLTQRILGNSQPKWIGGISNTFTFRNFSLSFLFDTQQGQYRYNQLGNFMAAFGIAKYTEDRNDLKIFSGVLADGTPNTQKVIPGQGIGPDSRNYGNGYYRNIYRGVTENFVEDASWVRLRNVSLNFTLPSDMFRSTFVQGASVSLTGNNLLLFTDYSGFDPESSSTPAGSNVDAFSGFTYPAVRSFLISLNVNF